MVVCPCSAGSVAAIAHGMSDNLIERAADVVMKERGQLLLVVRETPFSTLHLENMHKLSQMGVTIMPAAPGFYHQPKSIEDLVDFMVARILDHLGIDQAWCHAGVMTNVDCVINKRSLQSIQLIGEQTHQVLTLSMPRSAET